jgi:hypothetical protein
MKKDAPSVSVMPIQDQPPNDGSDIQTLMMPDCRHQSLNLNDTKSGIQKCQARLDFGRSPIRMASLT